MSGRNIIFWLSVTLVGAGRFLVPGHDLSWPGVYEAFAHIWVGVAGLLWVQNARWAKVSGVIPVWLDSYGYGLAFWGLATFELVMFLLRGRAVI